MTTTGLCRLSLVSPIIALLLLGPLLAPLQAEEREWKLVTDRDGIQVYRSHNDDSKIKTFRGEGIMPISDFRALGVQLNDYDHVASWMHMISSINEIARVSDIDRQIWVTTRLPWPVSNRDAAMQLDVSQDPHDYTVTVAFHAENQLLPPQDGYVRMPELSGMLRFKPIKPGEVHMIFEVVLDPGGYIPSWIANLILRDIPYFSLRRFSRVADHERFRGKDMGYYRIPPGWPGGEADMGEDTGRQPLK